MRALPENLRELLSLEVNLKMPILLISSEQFSTKYQNCIKDNLFRLGENARHMIVRDSTHMDIYSRRKFRESICNSVNELIAVGKLL